jgi:Zn ribbon nucleic-acid-binding protein
MDKYEYEQIYGERVIHCPIHNISGIDGCVACDDEERVNWQEVVGVEMVVKCVTCGYTSSEDEFITVEIKETGGANPICQGCYDGYMKQVEIVKEENTLKAERLAYSVNTDYLD